MPRAAVIENGVVVNVVAANDNELSGSIVATGNQPVSVGWTYANGVFSEPVRDLATEKAKKRAQIVYEWTRREEKGYILDVPGNLNSYLALTLANARSLKSAVDSAADVAAVDAIDVTVGWP